MSSSRSEISNAAARGAKSNASRRSEASDSSDMSSSLRQWLGNCETVKLEKEDIQVAISDPAAVASASGRESVWITKYRSMADSTTRAVSTGTTAGIRRPEDMSYMSEPGMMVMAGIDP